MKSINVISCWDCPFGETFEGSNKDVRVCTAEGYNRDAANSRINCPVPSWCPLWEGGILIRLVGPKPTTGESK